MAPLELSLLMISVMLVTLVSFRGQVSAAAHFAKDERTVESAQNRVCKYCEYCTFCSECAADCPCESNPETPDDKPNCHLCKYCRFCNLCVACYTVCTKGGFLDRVVSSLFSEIPEVDENFENEINTDIAGAQKWIDRKRSEL